MTKSNGIKVCAFFNYFYGLVDHTPINGIENLMENLILSTVFVKLVLNCHMKCKSSWTGLGTNIIQKICQCKTFTQKHTVPSLNTLFFVSTEQKELPRCSLENQISATVYYIAMKVEKNNFTKE